jgi:rSAM/selenodomain-associated transferase 1
MNHAFSEILQKHSSVILLGSDCPYIDKELLEEAFEKLRYSDIVIGPATDGGYYLIGMKKVYESLFTNMPWSSEHVFKITKNRMEDLSLNYVALKPLSDIDTEADWKNYQSFVKRNSR